ncbi:MAG: hypothetical protein AB1705_24935, partial [Verrucomicrobiota bacterium]
MKVAMLADFPVHCLPGVGETSQPQRHYATWLPQVAQGFSRIPGFEVHWVLVSPLVKARHWVEVYGQKFHVLPTGR